MKTKYYILGVLAILCLLGTGYYAWKLYDAYRKQVAEWNEVAKATFDEALWMEVNKRSEIPMYSYSSGEEGMITLKERIPDSVSVLAVNGWRKYKTDRAKYDNSLIKETKKRTRLSTLLEKYPLSIDSLSLHWNRLLNLRQVSAKSMIRYIITDWDLKNDTVYSIVNNSLRFDSLTVSYLGFRCEHELVGYVSYPYGLWNLPPLGYWGILLPWGILISLFVSYPSLEKFFRNKFIRVKIVEKEIHVADVAIDKAKIYELPGGIVFDSFVGTLTKDGLIHSLPPQSSLLLRLFLRKDNYRLTTTEIEQELWNGKGSVDNIYKAIQRLRVELKAVSSDLVIKNINGYYELK